MKRGGGHDGPSTRRRHADWPNIATCQDLAKDPRVEGIAVMNQLAHGPQEAVDRIGQIAGHLLHPPAIGLRVDPGDVHTAGLLVATVNFPFVATENRTL